MTRTRVAMAAALVTASTLVLAGQEPQFRSAEHTVSVYTTVVDGTGHLVPDLTRDDFEVYDNGKRQDITVFANDVQPITIVVMLDRSGSMAANFDLVRHAAEQFVANLLPDDRAKIGSFSDRIQIDPERFTSDREELNSILRTRLLPPGLTPLWNATAQAMDALANLDGRRVVLLFTDGIDTPQFGRSMPFTTVRGRAQVEEVMVYGIGLSDQCENAGPAYRTTPRTGGTSRFEQTGSFPQIPATPRGPGGTSRPPAGIPAGPLGGRPGIPWPGLPVPGAPPIPAPDPSRFPPPTGPDKPTGDSSWFPSRCTNAGPDPNLRELASVGGGGYFELKTTDDLASTFSRVAEELHHQYLIAFTASKLDNSIHQLEVRVRNSSYLPRARNSYFAGKQN